LHQRTTIKTEIITGEMKLSVCHQQKENKFSHSFSRVFHTYLKKGSAIAQVVSHRLSTTAAWVRAQVRSRGICGGQSGIGAGFLRALWSPLQILLPLTALHSRSIIRGWYNRPVVADVPSGLSLTPPHHNFKLTCFMSYFVLKG
jgi:hypothetical protein